MDTTNSFINYLLEEITKEQLFDDLYYVYMQKLKLQERVKELEKELEMISKDDTLNIRILKSELDIDYEQLEIMFRFLPLSIYFESQFQLIFNYFPTDVQKEKHKDLREKLYKILVDNNSR